MADNTTINAGSGGDTIATDDIGGVKYQRVKLSLGADGSASDAPIGGGVESGALRVTLASNSTGVIAVTDNAGSLTVDGSVSIGAALPAGDNNIGNVDIVTMPALSAGTNNIGDVDVLTVPAPLSTTGGGTEATALRVTLANDSTGLVSVDDNGGSLTVDGSVSLAGAIPAGSNNIGDVDVLSLPALPAGSNNIGDVDVLSVVPGTGATNLGKAVDAAAGSTDTGVAPLAVRDDSLSALTPAEGDYVPLRVNSQGALHVTGGGGGTQYNIDDVASATATGNVALVVRKDSAASLAGTDGDISALQVDANGALRVTGGGGGTEYTEDAAAAADPVGNALIMVRDDALSGQTSADGDNVAARGTDKGELYVKHVDAIPVTDNAGSLTVDGTVTANLAAGTNNIGDVDVLSVPAPLSTSGGGTEASALRVTIANDSTGVVSIDDNGASITVDGTVGLAAGTNNIGDVDVLTLPNVTLAAGTNTNEVVGDAAHDAAVAGNPLLQGGYASAAAPSDVSADGDVVRSWHLRNGAQATVITAAGALVGGDATNGLDVDVTRLPSGTVAGAASLPAGTNNIGDVDVLTVPAPLSTTGGGTEATALRVTLASDSTGLVSVDDNGGSLTVDGTVTANLAAGTNNIGDVDVLSIAAGDNNIGNVDIVTMPNVTLAAGTNTNEVVGDAAHDAAAAGNPVLIGAQMETPADSAPGTRASADGDANKIATLDGAVFTIPGSPQQWSARLTGSMTDTTVKSAPGAGLSLYITSIVYSIGAATASSILLEESTTTAKFGPHYLEAINGRGLAVTFAVPIKIAANTLLSATNTGSTTATLDVYGFTAPG